MIFLKRLQALHARTPERVAVTQQFSHADDLPVTLDELLRGSQAFARTYAREGIQSGEVIVLILQHSEDLLYAFWGAILHGAIPSIMPFLTEKLSPERYRADLSSLMSVTKPAAIVTYPEFEQELRSALREGDSVRSVIVSDKIEPQNELDFDSLAGFQRKAEDIVLLQHSSGTTGLQKGVALSLQVDVTATPKNNNGAIFVQTIADYPLVEAIKQNVVKHPVVPDGPSRAKLVERQSAKYTEKYSDYIHLGVIEWRSSSTAHITASCRAASKASTG